MRPTLYTILIWFFGTQVMYAQTIQIQSVVSGAHVNLISGNIKLSGSFGQPIANSDAGILTSGFYSAASNLLQENQAPLITLNPFDTISTNLVLSATITDLDGIKTDTIRLKPIGAADFKSVTLSNLNGNDYTYTLLAEDYDDMGMEYYLEASDPKDSISRYPSSGSLYAYTHKTTIDFPTDLLGFGKESADYRIISIPYQVNENNDIATLLTTLTALGNDGIQWRLYSYSGLVNGQHKFNEYLKGGTSNLERGKSYWLLINDEIALEAIRFADVTASANNQSELFTMSLNQGWNMVGNPYTLPINWDNVITYNTDKNVGNIKLYDNGFDNGNELLPFQGGIVYMAQAETIEIPFNVQTSSGGRILNQIFSKSIDDPNWQLDFSLKQGILHSHLGGIGMHESANETKDRFDDLNPPRFQSFLEPNFPHPEHNLGFFSKDIVNTQAEYVWNFQLDASGNDPIVITWDNSPLIDQQKELYLLDIQTNKLVDMKKSNQLIVSPGTGLKVYFGDDPCSELNNIKSSMNNPYPNPIQHTTNMVLFPVVLNGASSHSVDIQIMNQEGRIIKRLSKNDLSTGIHHLQWHLDYGTSPAHEMYFYRANIQSGTELKQFTGKLLISN